MGTAILAVLTLFVGFGTLLDTLFA